MQVCFLCSNLPSRLPFPWGLPFPQVFSALKVRHPFVVASRANKRLLYRTAGRRQGHRKETRALSA
jgi:hypothetical protein